jgi:hypothetical protein
MSGVLGQLIRSQKRAVAHCTSRVNPKAMELQTAKEILAEVFHARPGEVEEMIKSRLVESSWREEGLWPREFWLER